MEYAGNVPRSTGQISDWHKGAVHEEVIEPSLPIVDSHQHFYHQPQLGNRYLLDDYLQDIGSNNLVASVYIEAFHSMWRADGPKSFRTIGEVEFAAGMAAIGESGVYGPCKFAAAIVAYADLSLGDEVGEVLGKAVTASGGRLASVRYQVAYESGLVGSFNTSGIQPHALLTPSVQRGFAQLNAHGLCFDAWMYFNQLADLEETARSFPGVPIVLNHMGGVLGVGKYAGCSASDKKWRDALQRLARLPNVYLKVGGLGLCAYGGGFNFQHAPAVSGELARFWQERVDFCIDTFGAQRCMFESNFPVDKQGTTFTAIWNAFKLMTIKRSPVDRGDLFAGTAKRVYKMGGASGVL